MRSEIILSDSKDFDAIQVINIYKLNNWSSAQKPDQLIAALKNSHTLITAHKNGVLVGLGNAISDGHLVVYYPHLIVHPDYQGQGIGKLIMDKMQNIYADYHQQMLTADGDAVKFYEKCGFKSAGETQSMWIYSGNDH